MASEVVICNLALSHLGNRARVASISPPDGSVEADYCARFYGHARDEMLEMADWAFARTRVALALAPANISDVWTYAYQLPSDCVLPRRIITSSGTDNETDSERFFQESDLLYTHKEGAVLAYTRAITDPTKFKPSFVTALSYLIAAYLAGPLIKNAEGAKAAVDLRAAAQKAALNSSANDANIDHNALDFYPSNLAARNGLAGSSQPAGGVYPYGSGYAIS